MAVCPATKKPVAIGVNFPSQEVWEGTTFGTGDDAASFNCSACGATHTLTNGKADLFLGPEQP